MMLLIICLFNSYTKSEESSGPNGQSGPTISRRIAMLFSNGQIQLRYNREVTRESEQD